MTRGFIKGFLAVLAMAVLASGCGFKLRGSAQLPFSTAYVVGASGSSLGANLVRSLTGNGKTLASKAADADVVIRLDKESRAKDILALSGGGKVREYRLRHQVTLSVENSGGQELLAPATITTTRDFSYSDQQVLAKESEEALLYRDMEQDILRQIQRQLAYIKRAP